MNIDDLNMLTKEQKDMASSMIMKLMKQEADKVTLTDSETERLYIIYNLFKIDLLFRAFFQILLSAYAEGRVKGRTQLKSFMLDTTDLAHRYGFIKQGSGRTQEEKQDSKLDRK